MNILIETAKNIQPPVDYVAALDARGFLFGPIIALNLQVPFLPIRKKGKLPGITVSAEYEKEYGKVNFSGYWLLLVLMSELSHKIGCLV